MVYSQYTTPILRMCIVMVVIRDRIMAEESATKLASVSGSDTATLLSNKDKNQQVSCWNLSSLFAGERMTLFHFLCLF